jgi:serine/threonine protein kinase
MAPEVSQEEEFLYDGLIVTTPQTQSEASVNVQIGAFGAQDIWSLGIITKFLATGSTDQHLRPMVQDGMPYSDELIDFLMRCLITNPGRRSSAKKLLLHPFISRRKYKSQEVQGFDPFKLSDSELELQK